MILDAQTALATLYAPTVIGTAQAPNVLDLDGLADWGAGEPWTFFVNVYTAFVGATATLDLQLQGNNTDPTFVGGVTSTVIDSGVIPVASLVSGYQLKIKYPRGFKVRYLRLQSIVATANFTAGTLSAWLLNDDVQDNLILPIGYSVS